MLLSANAFNLDESKILLYGKELMKLKYRLIYINPFPNDKILDSSKVKDFADDNIFIDEDGRKFSKTVENTVRKAKIARDEQFLLFPQCFQKTCTADT